MTQTKAFERIVRLGTVPEYSSSLAKKVPADVFAKVEYRADGRLSICGVIGPLRNGNALGGCGQLGRESLAGLTPATEAGWTFELADRFLQVWDDWHLNDMRASCPHLRRHPDITRKVTMVTFKLNTETILQQRRIQDDAMKSLQATGAAMLTEPERALFALRYEIVQASTLPEPATEHYEEAKREEKTLGWLRPSEHKDGMLCRPCPTCGHKYGSSWEREDVPDDVLAFLQSLPETDKTPAWV